jgi:hypothetical protein
MIHIQYKIYETVYGIRTDLEQLLIITVSSSGLLLLHGLHAPPERCHDVLFQRTFASAHIQVNNALSAAEQKVFWRVTLW